MIRLPAVAGRFYPGDAATLRRQVQNLSEPPATPEEKVRAIGCLVPHAGYMYSGAVAGAVFRRLKLPQRIVILGPRHYPHGEAMAILSEGGWQTPLGDAQIDGPLAAALKRECPPLREDAVAHRAEHSLEVQLPFLQLLAGEFRFVPIALGTVHFPSLERLGHALAKIISGEKEPILLVASSDMSHYERDEVARAKDHKALERVLALDPRGLYHTVRSESISMCGYGPAVTMLTAARGLGARRAELVRYATSGDVTGDFEAVVGYAGILIH